MYDYRDQMAIVTGGTRGIGKAVTQALVEAGARVIATYARDADAAARLERDVARPELLKTLELDVRSYEAVERFFGTLETAPHILVNNAGIRRDAVVGLMPREAWREVLEVNLDGTYHMTKFAVMRMSRQRYGRIVNIVSAGAAAAFAGQSNYAASKAGQIAMGKAVAKEVASRNITVNAVSPGFIETDLLQDLGEEQRTKYVESVPMKRFGRPEEVASAVLFLASRAASYITGAVLDVHGGIQ